MGSRSWDLVGILLIVFVAITFGRPTPIALSRRLEATPAQEAATASAGHASAAKGATPSKTTPAADECMATNYAELLAHTNNPHCEDAEGFEEGIEMDLDLECDYPAFERGTMGALKMSVGLAKTWIISTDRECTHTIMINLTQNPALPAFTVTGDMAYNKIILEDMKFVVFGELPAMPVCAENELCDATPIIEIINVEDIELRGITVTSLNNQMLPFIGIKITTTAGGKTNILLDNVTVNHCVDGVVIDGGGNLNARNLKLHGNANYGLEYMCSFVQQSSVNISGPQSMYSNNARSGIFVDCDGDLSPPLTIDISDGVRINSNGGSGAVIEGHVHAHIGKVTFQGNGKGKTPPDCGGGLEVHFEYSSPELNVDGAEFISNTAEYGGGLCIEVPKTEDDFMGFTKGPVNINPGTKFIRNAATKCGGAIATLFEFHSTQLAVKVSKDVKVYGNKSPHAVGWCMMPTFDDADEDEDLYTSIDINN